MDDRADVTEITDEEIDRLIAEVTDECDIEDANDYDVVSEFDDVLMAVDSSKVESVTVKDPAKEGKPKEDRVGAEKSADCDNVKTKQGESTTKKNDDVPQTTSSEKELESKCPVEGEKPKEDSMPAEKSTASENAKASQDKSTTKQADDVPQAISSEKEQPLNKQQDEISVASAKVPSMKEKGANGSKATVSPETSGKPLGGKEAGNTDKKTSPVASGKSPGGKEAGNKDVKKASTKVNEKNAGEKEMGSASKSAEKTSKTPGGKEIGRNSKDVRSPGVKGGKQAGKKLDGGDRGQASQTGSAETTVDVSERVEPATAISKEAVTTSATAADTVVVDPIVKAATILADDNTTSSIHVPASKVTDVGEEVVPKSNERNVKEEGLLAPMPKAIPPGATDLETDGELKIVVAASSAVAAEEGQVKDHGKEDVVRQMPELVPKELTEDAAATVLDEEGQVKGHGKEKPEGKGSDKSKEKAGWGWNSIGSWGSNVLNQVGDSLYHVLETVESSLVEPEPEETGSTPGISSVKQPKDKEIVPDVVQLQPSTLIELATGDSTPLVLPDTQDAVKDKQGASASASSENQGACLTASDAALLEKNEKERAEHDEASGKIDQVVEQPGGQKEKKKARSSKGQSSPEQSWFSGWGLSQFTGAVQQTGKKVVSTGLDVLENIGKKTMSVLADEPEEGVVPLSPSSSGSPSSGSPKKKGKSGKKGQVKGKAQMLRKCFDDCQGLAHFEALTDLSQVSLEKLDKQVGRLSGDHLLAIKTDLTLIRDASDLGGMDWEASFGNTEHDFCQLVKDFVSQLSLTTNLQKLFTVQENTTKWLTSCLQDNVRDKKYLAEDVHKMAILMLADFTATGIAQFHKIAQLLLVDFSTPLLSYKFRALSLAGLTKVLCTEIWIETRLFTECLNQLESTESGDMVMSLITNLTLEASNCSSCLQDGYHLLLPVIQLAALKVHPLTTDNADIPNLEVLQMTSSMSQSKVAKILNRLSGDSQQTIRNDLSTVESAFEHSFIANEMEDDRFDQDFSLLVLESLHVISVDVTAQKLLQAQLRTRQWLTTCEQDEQSEANISAKDIHQRALQSLHDLTLCSVELFHQIAQVVLLENPREVAAYAKRAEGIKGLARAVCLEVGFQSSKFTKCLTDTALRSRKGDEPAQADHAAAAAAADSGISDCITPFITNVYLEASNSTTYIQDGFQLLLPIIQLALVKAHPVCAGISD